MDERFNKIENVFRNSTSPDLLFDAFQEAIKLKGEEPEIFKILLGNNALSIDEIKMFTEKLIKEFPDRTHELYIWTAKIFEHKDNHHNYLEDAVHYYKRAQSYKQDSYISLLSILSLYNYDLTIPINKNIIEFIEEKISAVNLKSKVYYALAGHYKKIGDKQLEIKYYALAERSTEIENGQD